MCLKKKRKLLDTFGSSFRGNSSHSVESTVCGKIHVCKVFNTRIPHNRNGGGAVKNVLFI